MSPHPDTTRFTSDPPSVGILPHTTHLAWGASVCTSPCSFRPEARRRVLHALAHNHHSMPIPTGAVRRPSRREPPRCQCWAPQNEQSEGPWTCSRSPGQNTSGPSNRCAGGNDGGARPVVADRPTAPSPSPSPRAAWPTADRQTRQPSQITTTSACAVTAQSGRLCDDHDFGLCLDCRSWPSVRPPRLRPVQRLLNTAVGATAAASTCTGTAHGGHPHSHHDFGLSGYWPSRPSGQPP